MIARTAPFSLRLLLIGGGLLASLLATGCTPVRFNQQQRLRQPDMQFAGDPQRAAIDTHIHSAREATVGGFDAAGGGAGGCGCN